MSSVGGYEAKTREWMGIERDKSARRDGRCVPQAQEQGGDDLHQGQHHERMNGVVGTAGRDALTERRVVLR